MQRQLLRAILIVALVSSAARGQEWARKMFTESSHDFGTVARGAKVEYRFELSNPYQETAHVTAVTSSCGCTSTSVSKDTLKTYEKSEIVANFNTRSTYLGNHSATLTVHFDKPFPAEVQLNVWGDIRSDLMVQPELVELGTLDQGQEVDRKLTVTHSGSNDWKILDVRSVNTNYEVEVKDRARSSGQVSYDLLVHLKKDAPPGYVKDQLILVTSDPHVTQFPIEVEGLVKAELSASPQSLSFGLVESGKVAKPQLIVVKGRRPFKITAVHCADEAFSFKAPEVASLVQIIPVTFTAPDKPGKLAKKIRIETDLGKSFVIEVIAQAEVKPSDHPAVAAPDQANPPADEKDADKIASPNTKSERASTKKAGPGSPQLEPVVESHKAKPSVLDAPAKDSLPANPVRPAPSPLSANDSKSGE